jgi:undecaprenyl-diphosphatase
MIVITLSLLGECPEEALRYAFFLHLGTALAAMVYFRSDISELISELQRFELDEFRKLATLSVIISGIVALMALRLALKGLEYGYAFVGLMLIITGLILELKRFGNRSISLEAAILAGIAQGLAVIPGLSRSGLTLVALGLVGVEGREALRFSFIISIPAVIAAAIFFGYPGLSIGPLVGLLMSFVFGLLTIDALMHLADRIRRGPFLVLLGLLAIAFYAISA